MRVVHLSTVHKPFDVRIFHKECRTLAEAGHQVEYLVVDPPSVKAAGIVFHALHMRTSALRPLRIWRRLTGVYRQAAALRADVYHFHDPELIPVGILLKRTGARVIYDVHEDAPREALALNREHKIEGGSKYLAWWLLEEAAKRLLDAFVCATPTIACRFPKGKTILVRNYPLWSNFESSGPSSRPATGDVARIVYVGGISAIRGIREMVYAMELVAAKAPAELVLVGDFVSPDLKIAVEQLPGWRHVYFLGWSSQDQVRQYLAESLIGLVVLHPERAFVDALPTKLFEYMAAGLPVVASHFPGWRKIVAASRCGLLVDPLDPRAIAQAIHWLLAHPAEAREMGLRGQEAVRTRYAWNGEAQKLIDLYGGAMRSNRNRLELDPSKTSKRERRRKS